MEDFSFSCWFASLPPSLLGAGVEFTQWIFWWQVPAAALIPSSAKFKILGGHHRGKQALVSPHDTGFLPLPCAC